MTTDTSRNTPLVVVAGNPNTGKTSLFNRLTGLRQKVGNYPGITVDRGGRGRQGRLPPSHGRFITSSARCLW